MSDGERFLIPRNFSPEHEAATIALTARLKPIAESPTVRYVLLTFWADGADRPLTRVTMSSQTLGRYREAIPLEATHVTIETSGV